MAARDRYRASMKKCRRALRRLYRAPERFYPWRAVGSIIKANISFKEQLEEYFKEERDGTC